MYLRALMRVHFALVNNAKEKGLIECFEQRKLLKVSRKPTVYRLRATSQNEIFNVSWIILN